MLSLPCGAAAVPPDLDYTAGIIRRHRRQIGSPWRKLTPGRQALLVLAQFKTWRIVRKLRCWPWRAGQLAKAVRVLQARGIGG
jgi:hypothetical protein